MTAYAPHKHTYRIRRILRREEHIPERTGSIRISPMVSAAAGIITGSLCSAFASDMPNIEPCSFISSFTDSLAVLSVYMLICFFCGFSAAGEIPVYLACIFKGMGAGMISGGIFRSGMLFSLPCICLLACEITGMTAVVLGAEESVKMSEYIRKKAFGSDTMEEHEPGNYLKKYAALTALGVLSAVFRAAAAL